MGLFSDCKGHKCAAVACQYDSRSTKIMWQVNGSYFPAQKACFPKAASESPAVHPTNDKTRRFVPGGKAPFELMSAGRDHSADCLVMAQLILTRLSAITPRPT